MLKWISNLAIEAANRFRTISGMQYDPEWVKNNPGWYNPPTAAGITVDEVTALNQSTVFAAVSVIAGTAASLPLPVYQRLESGGKRRSPEHPLYYAIHDEPNYDCSSLQFREALYAHVLTWGNGYAEIERDGAGRAIALWLLAPWQVEPTYNKRGDLKYEVTANGKKKTLWPEDIIHIAGLSFDGVKGYSVIKLARESLALNAATEKFGASFFGNAARPSGVFTHPNKLKPQAEEQFKKNIHDNYQGSANAGGALFLTEGVTYAPYTIPPEEAQFLGTRLFQISEVARWFKVHPYFLGDLSHSTFSNGEQAMIHFVIHTIRPFCIRAEQEFNRKLFLPSERRSSIANTTSTACCEATQ